MTEAAITSNRVLVLVLLVLMILMVVPGSQDSAAPERPKKGFWQARDLLWPVRRKLRGLWPANREFLKGYREALLWAWFAAGTANVAANAMTPAWLTVEFVVIGIFFGRAWGFWSADRRLRKIKAVEETASGESWSAAKIANAAGGPSSSNGPLVAGFGSESPGRSTEDEEFRSRS